MTPRFTGPVPDAVLYVASNMRAIDRAEIFATRWMESAIEVAEDTTVYPGFTWVGWLDTDPVVVFGAKPLWPNVWTVFAYATDKFQQIAWNVTRHIRRVTIPALVLAGAHRAQCHSLATHVEAHKWLESLGAVRECVVPRYGKGGEDFVLFGWTLESVKDVSLLRPAARR